jgi:hypothetical protein
MVGMKAIMTSPFPSTVSLLLQPALENVDKSQAITTTEDYHVVIITTERNVKASGGEYGITLEGQE